MFLGLLILAACICFYVLGSAIYIFFFYVLGSAAMFTSLGRVALCSRFPVGPSDTVSLVTLAGCSRCVCCVSCVCFPCCSWAVIADGALTESEDLLWPLWNSCGSGVEPLEDSLWMCGLWRWLGGVWVFSEAGHLGVVSEASGKGLWCRPKSAAACDLTRATWYELQSDLQIIATCPGMKVPGKS